MARKAASLHTMFVGLLLAGAVLPLGLVGLWLSESAVRSGRALLTSELDLMVDRISAGIQQRWETRHGVLLLLANNAEVGRAIVQPPNPPVDDSVLSYLTELYRPLRTHMPMVLIRDAQGAVRWQLEDTVSSFRRREPMAVVVEDPPLIVRQPIMERGVRAGELEAHVRFASLLPADSASRQLVGAVISIAAKDGTGLYASASSLSDEAADLVTVERVVESPAITITASAPGEAYVGPFRRAARAGTIALLVVAVLSLALTAVLSRRLTRPLSELAQAADAVTHGRLDQHVDVRGPDEVRRLGMGFNAMTKSLQSTLETMARQKTLAEIGEFAAELSHEVRNALTAIKVDLQRARRRPHADPATTLILDRALDHVQHLDRVVTGALHGVRSGHVHRTAVDLIAVLQQAELAVGDQFAKAEVRLCWKNGMAALPVAGDASALQQLFTNLLLNASEASAPGSLVEIAARAENGTTIVEVKDYGAGIPAGHFDRVWEPLFTTKAEGTGLGLPIARQIATAHGGELTLESDPAAGTVARVCLPLTSCAGN